MIVSRRSKEVNEKKYKVCPNCKDFYSKITLRRHYSKCGGFVKAPDRSLMVLSRKIRGRIHAKASVVLKTEVFPTLREDHITQLISYDELLITYANKLCVKYRAKYHHNMIRSKLRLLGRLLYNMKKINSSVTDFASIFNPEIYDSFVEAVNNLGKLSEDKTKYEKPAVAASLGTMVKMVGKRLICECIKKKDEPKQKNASQFLELLLEDYGTSVNKTVAETVAETSRQKKILLPTQKDISALNKYIKQNSSDAYHTLQQSYSFKTWKKLASYTLVSLQLFNRRRAGEMERAKVCDFNSYQSAEDDVNKDIQSNFSKNDESVAHNYIRFCIRGKLNRSVPVLANNFNFKCLELIVKFRQKAGVPEDNPYLFGLPNSRGGIQRYLSACQLLRKYSVACGAQFPERLRGTELRKHLATRSAVLDYDDTQVSELANFMGHAEAIHRTHYRLSLPTRQIVKTSKILEGALDGSGRSSGRESTDISVELDDSISQKSETCRDSSRKIDDTLLHDSQTASDEDAEFEENFSDNSESPSIVHRLNIRGK